MHEFIAKHQEQVVGVLSGFDRVVFRGTLRPIAYAEGLKRYLTDKDALARRIMAADGITRGLVGVLSCVEPCQSFEIRRDRETQKLVVAASYRKCLFLYHYWVHPVLGFMNARIQTWFPFAIQVCLNGREWLARQLEAAGLQYVRRDNCFPWVEDWATAQRLLDRQVKAHWPKLLDGIARQLNPIHAALFRAYPLHYYWSTYQSEWATDLVFRDAAPLRRLYPRLLHHAVTTFGSVDVMRFLGRRLPPPSSERHRPDALCRGGREYPPTAGGRHSHQAQRERQRGQALRQGVHASRQCAPRRGDVQHVADLRVYRPRKGTPTGSWRGGPCAAESPISTGGQRCRGKPPNATWMPWPASMTRRRWTNSSGVSASPPSGAAAGSGHSVRSTPETGPCSLP
jgi:hypothetical protein